MCIRKYYLVTNSTSYEFFLFLSELLSYQRASVDAEN